MNKSNIFYVNAVVIRTKGQECELIIDGKGGTDGDTVNHYGYASTIKVNSVDTQDCYNEYGTAKTLVAKEGKINIQSTGIVFNLNKAEGATATYSNNGGNIMKADNGTLPSSTVFSINSYDQFIAFRDATNSGENFKGLTVELNCDIQLNEAWVPISNYNRNDAKKVNTDENKKYVSSWFAGTFNGKNHTISGLTNSGIKASDLNTGHNSTTPNGAVEYCYGLFASTNGATLKNLNLKDVNIVKFTKDNIVSEAVGGLVGYAFGNTTIDNINVSGDFSTDDVVGGIVGTIREGESSIKNCTCDANIISDNRASGIVGTLCGECYLVDSYTEVINCKFSGSVKTNSTSTTKGGHNTVAGICIIISDNHNKEKISGCSFESTASITGTCAGKIWANQTTCQTSDSVDDYTYTASNYNGKK